MKKPAQAKLTVLRLHRLGGDFNPQVIDKILREDGKNEDFSVIFYIKLLLLCL